VADVRNGSGLLITVWCLIQCRVPRDVFRFGDVLWWQV